MSQFNDSRIIAPPIEDEVYPYRRVWRSIIIQLIITAGAATGLIFLAEILGIGIDAPFNIIVTLSFAILPVIVWLGFSVLPERFVQEPRVSLITTALISGLMATAVGNPLIQEFFQIDQWLPLGSAIQRIIGFAFTVGIVDSAIRFVLVRYIYFPQYFRIRTDPIAYFVASSVGYSFVINLFIIVELQPVYSIATILIFANYTMQIASCLFLAYGFSQTYFSHTFPIFMPLSIVLSAFVIGIISPLVSGLMNGSLSLDGSFSRPLFSLGFLIAMLFVSVVVIFFLFNSAEQREKEAFANRD